MFLHLSVILSTGGSAPVHARIHPPKSRPPSQEQTTPQEQTPPQKQTLSRNRHPPPREQTATAADGMHPTGMHSCC